MKTYLDFEQPIADLEGKILELQHLAESGGEVDVTQEVSTLREKANQQLVKAYANLTGWQKTQVARHPERPHFYDYVNALIDDFTPLCGDRAFGDDKALIGGIGRFRGRSIMVIGTEKGRGTEGRVKHNFGMARPEGYRKAQRLMKLADHYRLPVLTLVDTPAAYPGVGAEERGQAEAIARSIDTCLAIEVPLITCIVGEGGSGGAVALAIGNKVLMLEHAIYSVIPPEACSSILWRSTEKAVEAAEALKLTAQNLQELGVVDEIIPEPLGGAHRGIEEMIDLLGLTISRTLDGIADIPPEELREARHEKFLAMGRA